MGYKDGMTVKATGARGEKVLTIHKVLGNGKYLLKNGDKVLKKTYDSAGLCARRVAIRARICGRF